MRLQFNGPKLPIVIPVSLQPCLAGLVFLLFMTRLPVGVLP